ncbi:MAG: DUF6029 family protein [Prevotella sp.]|nr:DUF6029 family protein [Prevotella sp.]
MRKQILVMAVLAASAANAQVDLGKGISLTGSIQSDMLVPTGEQADGSNEDFRTNTYADVSLSSKMLDFGVRLEYLEHPLPGFETDRGFKGWGVANAYGKFHIKDFELTVGNYYEQFGSGFILRTYEERSLGIDNSLLGGRVVIRPFKGVQLKALAGVQRHYWSYNDALISGADMELSLNQWFKGLAEKDANLTLGASWVNKHGDDDAQIPADATHILKMPKNVNSFDVRASFNKGGFNILAEYAQKDADPSFKNNYIYRKGYVGMLSTSYSKKGMSILLQAKRSDNFSSVSDRTESGSGSAVNHLPAFTEDHTYALAALYPYNTNKNGEWAYQAQFGYNFKRRTALGGKYGMNVKVNFSHVHAIDMNYKSSTALPDLTPGSWGTDGYGSAFWKWGDKTFYQDLNVQVERRIAKGFKLNLMYMNQFYNKTVIEGEGGMIHSNIFVADGLFTINPKTKLRVEAQYLTTGEDEGDWIYGLAELSLAPHWMITASDMYNAGETKEHYWQTYLTYNIKSHRIQLGWGRTRAGYNCSGGVCRYIPQTKGFTVSYNYNF